MRILGHKVPNKNGIETIPDHFLPTSCSLVYFCGVFGFINSLAGLLSPGSLVDLLSLDPSPPVSLPCKIKMLINLQALQTLCIILDYIVSLNVMKENQMQL